MTNAFGRRELDLENRHQGVSLPLMTLSLLTTSKPGTKFSTLAQATIDSKLPSV